MKMKQKDLKQNWPLGWGENTFQIGSMITNIFWQLGFFA
jgi:hypothetical protein